MLKNHDERRADGSNTVQFEVDVAGKAQVVDY
jgi:hypothetical protein